MERYTVMIGKSWGFSPNLIRANNQEYKDTVKKLADEENAKAIFPPDSSVETIIEYEDDIEPNTLLWEQNNFFLFKSEKTKKYCCDNIKEASAISYLEKSDEKAFMGKGFYILYGDEADEELQYYKIEYCPFCGKKV